MHAERLSRGRFREEVSVLKMGRDMSNLKLPAVSKLTKKMMSDVNGWVGGPMIASTLFSYTCVQPACMLGIYKSILRQNVPP